MRHALRPLAAASLAAALALSGCKTIVTYEGRRMPRKEARELCRKSFAACAPKPRFDVAGAPVDAMSVPELVQVASRLDVPDDRAEDAVLRLRRVMVSGDRKAMREVLDAAETAEVSLARCRCEGKLFPSQLERFGILAAARGAFPARLESPEHWADAALPSLVAARTLLRRVAELTLNGAASDEQDKAAAELAETRRRLCQTVKEARAHLAPDALPTMFEIALRKYGATVGAPENAKQLLDEAAAADSCVAPRDG